MKILCFGDSNTYGYDPRSYLGDQYPAEHRWVDLLAEKLCCEAVNAGQNGREIPVWAGALRSFERMLASQAPLDLLLVMLGVNDLLQGNSVAAVSQRMESFLEEIPLEPSKILLIAPPRIQAGTWVTTPQLITDCLQLNKAYGVIAEKLGVRFIDTANWEINMTFDGVHFTERGHQTFAEQLSLII